MTNQEHIAKLHPSIRQNVTNIINQCDVALSGRSKVKITQSLRTFKEQDDLYALGRSKQGKKVTQAKGGQSIHNYGLAVDICLIIDKTEASWDMIKDWDGDKVADWMEVVKIFKSNGFSWGGDWHSFKDNPHFEMPKLEWRRLLDKYKANDFLPNTTYIKL
jgi:peptidoglycan L-alanyl-D-glutamate endopeptidase CwlK